MLAIFADPLATAFCNSQIWSTSIALLYYEWRFLLAVSLCFNCVKCKAEGTFKMCENFFGTVGYISPALAADTNLKQRLWLETHLYLAIWHDYGKGLLKMFIVILKNDLLSVRISTLVFSFFLFFTTRRRAGKFILKEALVLRCSHILTLLHLSLQ